MSTTGAETYVTPPPARCPHCLKAVLTQRDLNGIGQRTGPVRMIPHSGNRWGRSCKGSGELAP